MNIKMKINIRISNLMKTRIATRTTQLERKSTITYPIDSHNSFQKKFKTCRKIKLTLKYHGQIKK